MCYYTDTGEEKTHIAEDLIWPRAIQYTYRNNVRYRGYALTMDGREYKIADLPNTGIDFSKQNTYLRGRIDNLGNTVPTGLSLQLMDTSNLQLMWLIVSVHSYMMDILDLDRREMYLHPHNLP